jgi:hypothetical protein
MRAHMEASSAVVSIIDRVNERALGEPTLLTGGSMLEVSNFPSVFESIVICSQYLVLCQFAESKAEQPLSPCQPALPSKVLFMHGVVVSFCLACLRS